MKLKFDKDTYYGPTLYALAGEIKEVEDSFAKRWLVRGAQEVIEETPKEIIIDTSEEDDLKALEGIKDIPSVIVDTKKGKTTKGK